MQDDRPPLRLAGLGEKPGRLGGGRVAWHARPLWRTLLAYAAALVILGLLAHTVSLSGLRAAAAQARPSLFLGACLVAALGWLIGDAFLFSRLFSYFRAPVGFAEMLPANAMHEFLQLLDTVAAGLVIAGFVHRRSGLSFLAAGATMLLQGLVDFQVIAWGALLAVPRARGMAADLAWYYPALVVACTWIFAAWWMVGRPHTRLGAWLRQRPALQAFRMARPSHYLRLSLIRALIYASQGVALYGELRAFNIPAPLRDVFALEAAILLLGALPIAPAGLGVRQVLTVTLLRAFAPRATLLAAALAHSAMMIIFRMLMGLLFAGRFARLLAEPRAGAAVLHQA